MSSVKPGVLSRTFLISTAFFLEHVESRAEDFYRQGALEAGESFVDGILGGMGVVENHTRVGFEFSGDLE